MGPYSGLRRRSISPTRSSDCTIRLAPWRPPPRPRRPRRNSPSGPIMRPENRRYNLGRSVPMRIGPGFGFALLLASAVGAQTRGGGSVVHPGGAGAAELITAAWLLPTRYTSVDTTTPLLITRLPILPTRIPRLGLRRQI